LGAVEVSPSREGGMVGPPGGCLPSCFPHFSAFLDQLFLRFRSERLGGMAWTQNDQSDSKCSRPGADFASDCKDSLTLADMSAAIGISSIVSRDTNRHLPEDKKSPYPLGRR